MTYLKQAYEQPDLIQENLNNKNQFSDSELAFSIIENNTNQINDLINLLPYDPSIKNKKELEIGLKEYKMLLNAFEEAVNEYQLGNLEKFDSIVGENACQIRAVRFILMKSKKLIKNQELDFKKNEVLNFKNKIIDLLSPKKIAYLMQSQISLKDLLEKENLLLILTNEEMFLLQSYLLAQAKISQSSEDMFFMQSQIFCNKKMNSEKISNTAFKRSIVYPKNLKKFGDVSSNFTEHLIRKIRKHLSKASVDFVRDVAFLSQDESLKKMTSENFITRHLNCYCIPMFWTYKTLFIALQEEKIPIILHAKFLSKKEDGKYKIINEEYIVYKNMNNIEEDFLEYNIKNNNQKPVFVVQGIVYQNSNENFCKEQWKKNIFMHSIKNIILSGAADHRQYPDSKLDDQIEKLNDSEYKEFKNYAQNNGFSIDNPSCFFIQHVYASQMNKFEI